MQHSKNITVYISERLVVFFLYQNHVPRNQGHSWFLASCFQGHVTRVRASSSGVGTIMTNNKIIDALAIGSIYYTKVTVNMVNGLSLS